MKKVIPLVLILFTKVLWGQDEGKLIFMNGKEMEVTRLDDSTYTELRYQFDKNQFKRQRLGIKDARKKKILYSFGSTTEKGDRLPVVLKDGRAERDEIFSFVSENGEEKVYYFYDEVVGNYLEENEMRAFVYGERDARYSITGKGWFYTGLAAGTLTGYFSRTSILALAVPPVFALSAKIPTIRIRKEYISDLSYQYNEDYAAGFESYARSKNTIEALKGSALGTLLGIVAYIVVDNNF